MAMFSIATQQKSGAKNFEPKRLETQGPVSF